MTFTELSKSSVFVVKSLAPPPLPLLVGVLNTVQQAPLLVVAGMPLLLGLKNKSRKTISRFLSLKIYSFGLFKKSVFGFWRKTPQKMFFFVFRLWFSFKNTRHTKVLWVCIFDNAQKKVVDCQTRHFGCFWQLISLFWAFSKILMSMTFVRILFLKLNHKKIKRKQIVLPLKKWNKNLQRKLS